MQQLLKRLIDNINDTVSEASSVERAYIREAVMILQQCIESIIPEDSRVSVRQELLAQLKWAELYATYQKKYPTYRLSGNGSLIPKAEDDEVLLLRMAVEILEGARTLRALLSIPSDFENEWIYIQRRCEKKRSATDHIICSHEPSFPEPQDESDDEAENSLITQFTYQYWYF
jgi:hypothetical protein